MTLKSVLIGAILVILLSVPNVYASSDGFSGDDFISSKSQRPTINEDFNPDKSCQFDVFQLKCIPGSEQDCHEEGFGNNDADTCFPLDENGNADCPDGYGLLDDDETGQCYPKDEQDN